MKIRKSSRITAIVLALMMIVPLISVPTFAEISATEDQIAIYDDFEGRTAGESAVGNGLYSGPTTTTVEYYDEEHGNVLKYDLTPDTVHKDGTTFIKSSQSNRDTWYTATITKTNENLLVDEETGYPVVDEVTGEPVVESLTYDGTVNIGGDTYYFHEATMNTNAATTAVSLYADAAYEDVFAAYTYYLCSAQVRNAIQGQTNIATPSVPAGTPGLEGTEFVFSADYCFDTNYICSAMDVRMRGNNGDIHFATIKRNGTTLNIVLHADLKEGRLYDQGGSVTLGQWFNLTVAVKSDGTKSMISMYLDGKLIGYAEQARAFTALDATQATSAGWNLGHVQRGGNVSAYAGNYYVDNIAVYNTLDVIADWEDYDPNKLTNEDFEGSALGTTLPSTVTWGGDTKEIVSAHGDKELKIDATASGNLDKPLTVKGCAVTEGILRIDVDYYIPSGSAYQFQGQLAAVTSDKASTLGGDVESNDSSSWIDLYMLKVENGTAWIRTIGDGSNLTEGVDKVTYFTAVPMDETFTLSTVIDMATGEAMLLVNDATAAEFYIHRNGFYLTNITMAADKILVAKLNKLSTAGMSAFSGEYYVDNIKIAKIDAMPEVTLGGASHDFEDKTVGEQALSPNNTPTAAPSTATYADLLGNKVVSISMLGATEATTLDAPFISVNSRSYDLTVASESFTAPEELTLDWLTENTTFTGSINNVATDKPIYYVYVESENTVYVYNNGGNVATESNIGGFNLTTYTIGDANYNAMFRAMCGGRDANIDKNFRVSHPGLSQAGTYVLSADYFVANDAVGEVQSQSYNTSNKKWLDLYRLNLETRTFHSQSGGIVAGEDGQPLIVDEWNTVTMIVTVAEDLTFSVDFYLNGVYCFTKNYAYGFEADSWILAKIGKPSLDYAQKLAGYIYIDNVKVNADKYDESKITIVDASKVMGFDIDYKSIVNVSSSTELKIYANESVVAYDADMMLNRRFSGIIATEDTASIRLDDPTGLRFATNLDAGMLTFLEEMIASGQLKGYNHGTLIAPLDAANNAEGKDLTFENFTENVDMLDVESTNGMYYEVDDQVNTIHFVGSIINIKNANMDRDFTGRGYIQIETMNGYVVTIYSSSTKTISVADQAQATIDAGAYAADSAEYAILAEYAAYAN
ncbi:MAG: hypothetical protein IJW30_04025 [Clostridia bacterium]|nr:hypothetical protein [Clostridia bacterium]